MVAVVYLPVGGFFFPDFRHWLPFVIQKERAVEFGLANEGESWPSRIWLGRCWYPHGMLAVEAISAGIARATDPILPLWQPESRWVPNRCGRESRFSQREIVHATSSESAIAEVPVPVSDRSIHCSLLNGLTTILQVSGHPANRMEIASLAKIFAPNILRDQDTDPYIEESTNSVITITVAAFIKSQDDLFQFEYEPLYKHEGGRFPWGLFVCLDLNLDWGTVTRQSISECTCCNRPCDHHLSPGFVRLLSEIAVAMRGTANCRLSHCRCPLRETSCNRSCYWLTHLKVVTSEITRNDKICDFDGLWILTKGGGQNYISIFIDKRSFHLIFYSHDPISSQIILSPQSISQYI